MTTSLQTQTDTTQTNIVVRETLVVNKRFVAKNGFLDQLTVGLLNADDLTVDLLSADGLFGNTLTVTGISNLGPTLFTDAVLISSPVDRGFTAVNTTTGNSGIYGPNGLFLTTPSTVLSLSGSDSGTTLKVSVLPAFMDDAAAGGGGLTTGDLFQTDGTGAAPLNAPGIVMIKQ